MLNLFKNGSRIFGSCLTMQVNDSYVGNSFSHVSEENWNDWKWQLRNRVVDVDDLVKYLPLCENEIEELRSISGALRMAISPYYLSLIDTENLDLCPIKKQSVPSIHEMEISACERLDDLGEDCESPCRTIVHKYPDRVLFLATDRCSMYCRHCTRRRIAGKRDEHFGEDLIEEGLSYIRANPQIRDVLISGGDPLLLPTEVLDDLLSRLEAIDHVEVIRIGSRVPVVLPMRIDDELCDMLKKHHPLWLNTHFNSPHELTETSEKALAKLADAGIPLGNQSVLLSGINDNLIVMKALVQGLVKNRVRPYYIYECTRNEGIGHFRTPISKGIEIIEGLRQHTSGLCIPHFVNGMAEGKIPLMPNYVISQNSNKTILRNFEGVITCYEEPRDYKEENSKKLEQYFLQTQDSNNYNLEVEPEGVISLLLGTSEGTTLEPSKGISRLQRRKEFMNGE